MATDWHGRWRSHKPGQALVEQNVAGRYFGSEIPARPNGYK